MDKRYLTVVSLMLLFSIGCTDSGDPIGAAGSPLSDAPASSGPNGIHTGEIWIADNFGSERFNLQTGETVEVSKGYAYPSRDGSVFIELLANTGTVPDEYCQFRDIREAQTINIKKPAPVRL